MFDGYTQHAGYLLVNGRCIRKDQAGTRLVRPALRPAAGETGCDEYQVRTKAGDLIADGGFRTGADRDHHDDRCNADNDAQHRQQRTNFIFQDRVPGNSNYFTNFHNNILTKLLFPAYNFKT